MGSDIVDSDYPPLGQTRYGVVKCKVSDGSRRGSKYLEATSVHLSTFCFFFVICVANECNEYIAGIYIMNLHNENTSIYTDSDLDSATSNDADLNGNKFSKNPHSKLSTNTSNIFPSESDVSSR